MALILTLGVFVFGLGIVALTLQDAFEVMLLPRRVHRRLRIMRIFFDASWKAWSSLGQRIKKLEHRERFLSLFGPVAMIGLFAVWTCGLIVGFGMLFWSLEQNAPGHYSLASYLYLSGVTLFTLGYGDLTPHLPSSRVLAVTEAATGFGMIAVIIGYLPVLNQLFTQRETHVIQLDGRAGSPPTAKTLLVRHAQDAAMPRLDELLRDWELWCAELIESHLSYPMLSFYRSQHANQNWLAALTAITDCCAIIMVGLDGVPRFQAKMTFAMARLALVELCGVFSLPPLRASGGKVERETFEDLTNYLRDAGLNWSDPGRAREELSDFLSTYRHFADSLANFLMIGLPALTAPEEDRRALDNWQQSSGGRSAKELVENAQD